MINFIKVCDRMLFHLILARCHNLFHITCSNNNLQMMALNPVLESFYCLWRISILVGYLKNNGDA